MTSSVMHRIAAGYIRRRHTLGFGIHSPLAYRLVRSVLLSRDSYYAYPDIDDSVPPTNGCGKRKRRARMLHRLCARFSRQTVVVDAPLSPELSVAVQFALPQAEISSSACAAPAIYLLNGCGDAAPLIDGDILFLDNADAAAIEKVWDRLKAGVLLYDKTALIAVADSRVAKVRYSVRI